MKKRLIHVLSVVSICWCGMDSVYATDADLPAAYVDATNAPAQTIAGYNLFKDIKRQIPNDGVIPYDLNTPHFADYATLHRFIWLPPDTHIAYQADHTLKYPIGAVVILTVGYPHDLRKPGQGERLVETRLLVKGEEEWDAYQYIWNSAMTDARLALAGGKMPVSWIHDDGTTRAMDVYVPNKNQCAMCHEINGKFIPLGPLKARHLNKDYTYSGDTENQLAHWTRIGYMEGTPNNLQDVPRTPKWDDPDTGNVNDRARAYLDMNCSSCHQEGGLAWTSGLDLRVEQTLPVRIGIYKSPVAAGRGVGVADFGILPGDPEGSILFHRLRSTDPGVRMPVVGRGLVHEEGLELIRNWIKEMKHPETMLAQKNELERITQKQNEWVRNKTNAPLDTTIDTGEK